MTWCHGKLYVADGYNGAIREYTFDSGYNMLSDRKILQLKEPIKSILGLECDPLEGGDADFKLYFTHSWLYSQGGKKPTKFAQYTGTVRSRI